MNSPRTSEVGSTRAQQGTCIYVVGAHRSGTSAVAESLARLGLTVPAGQDLIPANPWNEHGHWESKQLVGFNRRLLDQLGGTWSIPPVPEPGWESNVSFDDLRAEAVALFEEVFPAQPAVFKDPRLCITLPFWQTVLDRPCAAIFVYREPLEVVASLGARNGLGKLHALALWERYARAAAANLDGVAVLAKEYGGIVADPAAWSRALVEFLSGTGIRITHAELHAVQRSIDPGLRHHRVDIAGRSFFTQSAQDVMAALRRLEGAHDPWRAPSFGEEPAWVGDVLSMRLEIAALERRASLYEASRPYRLAAWAQRHLRRV